MATAAVGCRDQRVTLVEVILDVCGQTFGQGGCTATGEACYNNWNNCKDQCNFECKTQSYWFSTCILPAHLGTAYTPNIVKVDSNPTTLEIGSTFSTRGRINVTFQDDSHNDQGFDPYWPRGAIPICAEDMPGTLFGRWIQRVKYFENRKVNVYHGYCDQQLCEMIKESYFIDKISGPSAGGSVTFNLKDPLILADDKNAQCPSAETRIVATQIIGSEYPLAFSLGVNLDGYATDNADAKPYSEVGKYILKNNYLLGDEDQDAFFARLRHVKVAKEILEVRAEVNNATPRGWNLVLLDRAVCGSTLGPHNSGVALSPGETFENIHVADAVCRMLTDCSDLQDIAVACCADVESSLINFESIEAFRCASPLAFISKALVMSPTGLTTLLDELSDQFLFFLYYDSATGKIEMVNLAPPPCDIQVPTITECQIVGGSFSVRPSDDRYNQIVYLYDTVDCSQKISKDNTASAIASVSADSLKSACDRREYKTRKTKTIISRWIDAQNCYLATANGERWLQLRACPPDQVTIDVSFEIAECINMGGFARIHHSKLQSMTGGYQENLFMLKGKSNVGASYRLVFERTAFDGKVAPYFNCDTECPTMVIVPEDCPTNECIGVW